MRGAARAGAMVSVRDGGISMYPVERPIRNARTASDDRPSRAKTRCGAPRNARRRRFPCCRSRSRAIRHRVSGDCYGW